jgi:hypothetical protein
VQQIAVEAETQLPVPDLRGGGEVNRPAPNLIAELRLLLLGLPYQVSFQLPHLAEQGVESVIHGLAIGCAGLPEKAGAAAHAAIGIPVRVRF